MPIVLSAVQVPSVPTVIALGLGTVFVGLACIIALIYIMGAIVRAAEKKTAATEVNETKTVATATEDKSIPNRGELVAAISAVVAEELGVDISKIRIHSIKRL